MPTASQVPLTRISPPKIFALNSYWVGLSFMWNSLHVIILPAVLLHYAPETQKNTYLGLLTFVGLVIAMLVQPISGALSDRWVSRWGRRRPLIAFGTAFDLLFLAILGWAGGLPWLFVGYIGLQFSSNIAHGPAQGLQPDLVPPEQLGAASGIKNLMDMLGLIAASLLMGRLVDPAALHPTGPMLLVIGLLAAGALVTLFGVKEQPASPLQVEAHPAGQSLLHSLARHPSFAWLVAGRLAFLLGLYGIQTFAQYYVRDVLRPDNPVQLTGDLLAAIAVSLTLFAVAGGWLGDRWGHERILAVAGIIGAAGCVLMLGALTPTTLLIFGTIVGIGVGLFLTSNWALANRLAPAGEAGKFLGLTNLATAGSAAISRLTGPLIDLGNNTWPGAFAGYTGLFLFGALCMLVSVALLRKVKLENAASIPPAAVNELE